ncbi:hypothetical protein GCM10027570_21030 [Streptomonospora sediminis]
MDNGRSILSRRKGAWTKSSYSLEISQCVEAALSPDQVGMRDSVAPESAQLAFPHREWVGLLHAITTESLR